MKILSDHQLQEHQGTVQKLEHNVFLQKCRPLTNVSDGISICIPTLTAEATTYFHNSL